jgi:hypothetical protein
MFLYERSVRATNVVFASVYGWGRGKNGGVVSNEYVAY